MTEIEDFKPHQQDGWFTTLLLIGGVLLFPVLLLWGVGQTYLW